MSEQWTSIQDESGFNDIQQLVTQGAIERLKITDIKTLTVSMAKCLNSFDSVRCLWIWCEVTRAAMRHVLSVPGLQELDILEIKHRGKLPDFASVNDLRVFRCNHYMSETDLLQISKSKTLVELGAQCAEITLSSIEALLAMPELKSLDLEGSDFNDEMAHCVAEADSLISLEIGASKLTAKGLGYLSQMTQLKSLDLWANRIGNADLDMLLKLSQLEYLSIGGDEGQVRLTGDHVVTFLLECQSLKRVWLDGIDLSEKDKQVLMAHFEVFRCT